MSPNYTFKPAGTELSCPCYQSDKELDCDNPKGTEKTPVCGTVNPCTLSVKRLQRDWCKKCR